MPRMAASTEKPSHQSRVIQVIGRLSESRKPEQKGGEGLSHAASFGRDAASPSAAPPDYGSGSSRGFLMESLLTYKSKGDAAALAREVATLKGRVAVLEKSVGTGGSSYSTSGASLMLDGLSQSNFRISTRNVEMCGTVGFFLIGAVVGASLLDRLWLIGGAMGAYWAHTVNKSDSKSGELVRKTGAQLALGMKEVVDMYNQFVIFYKTGKLGYRWSQEWDKWDSQYDITNKLNRWKRSVVERSTQFGESQTADQFKDFWNAAVASPHTTKNINRQCGITSNMGQFFSEVGRTIGDGIAGIMDGGYDDRDRGWGWGRGAGREKGRGGGLRVLGFWGSNGRGGCRKPLPDHWAGPFGASSPRRRRGSRRAW